MSTINVNRPVVFVVPQVPNYILHEVPAGRRQDGWQEGPKTDVADLSIADIDRIGAAWTQALRANAAERRATAKVTR